MTMNLVSSAATQICVTILNKIGGGGRQDGRYVWQQHFSCVCANLARQPDGTDLQKAFSNRPRFFHGFRIQSASFMDEEVRSMTPEVEL